MERQEPQLGIEEPELIKPKGLLYHYTSLDGFIGIINSDNLYATHIRYMNDSKEFIDVIDHLDSLIDESGEIVKLIQGSTENVRRELKAILQSSLSFFSGKYGAYIISFTDDETQLTTPDQVPGDRLSQWRAYSVNGKGISLGFDYNILNRGGKNHVWFMQGYMAYLLYCIYHDYDKRMAFKRAGASFANQLMQIRKEIIASEISKYLNLKVDQTLSDSDPVLALIGSSLVQELMINATTFKDPTYFEEKEWRIVIYPSHDKITENDTADNLVFPVKYRNGTLGITPYFEYPLGLKTSNTSLRRIVVGPTPHTEEAVIGVKMFLEEKGIRLKSDSFPNGVEVLPSKIPYRNW